MADPMSLQVAHQRACARTSGLPEQLNLSQAAIHLATAPKSNRAALAIWNADVQAGAVGEGACTHLRSAHYQGAKSLGHGVGYDLPSITPRGMWRSSTCQPNRSTSATTTDACGAEAAVAWRMEKHDSRWTATC